MGRAECREGGGKGRGGEKRGEGREGRGRGVRGERGEGRRGERKEERGWEGRGGRVHTVRIKEQMLEHCQSHNRTCMPTQRHLNTGYIYSDY